MKSLSPRREDAKFAKIKDVKQESKAFRTENTEATERIRKYSVRKF